MPTPPVHHPPNPTGATTHERGIVHRLHRAAMTTPDQLVASTMLDGLGLLVELIEARNRRQSRADRFEHDQSGDWSDT